MKGYWIALVNVTDADTYAKIRLADATSVAEIQCQNYRARRSMPDRRG